MWPTPCGDEARTHDHGRFTHQEVRRLHRRRRRHLHRQARPGDRLPRPQRRRQVHHHADHGRPDPAHVRRPPPSTVGGSPTCPTPASRSASCSTPRPSTPAAPAARSSPSPSARWACPRPGSTRCSTWSASPTNEAERRVRNYSLGMRQRLGIATALIGDPEVLILDEPANGLDPAGIRWMRDLLRGYADQGGTVLLSSHLLHEIEVIADDLVVIGNGRIVAQGTKAELLAGRRDRRTQPATTPASPSALDGRRHRRSPLGRRRPPHRRRRRPGRPGRPRRRRRPDRARVRRRRRPRGDVPRAHRRHPTRRSSSMTHHDRRARHRRRRRRPSGRPARIPMTRLIVGVELRKMFDTRSGFWLMASIGITARARHRRRDPVRARRRARPTTTFAAAIGFPMAVILPMIAILRSPASGASAAG